MKNEVDSKFVLQVFEKIRLHGEQSEQGHFLEGINAYTDFDGYTLYLTDALVTLSFGFHNQYHFDYEQSEHLEQFQKKLKHISEQY